MYEIVYKMFIFLLKMSDIDIKLNYMNKENQINQIKKIIKKLDKTEFNALLNLIKKDDSLSEYLKSFEEEFATKKMALGISLNEKKDDSFNFLKKIYADDINKISSLINNEDILKQIGGAKILLFGETGTGKTSFVEVLKENNPIIEFEKIDLENLISPKMGQTQISLLSKAVNLNNKYKNSRAVIFIDELDSFIHNRAMNSRNSSDVTEHSRIIATFLKFLDSLNTNLIIVAATNVIDLIDSAVIRRFNIKVEGIKVSFKDLILEANDTFIAKQDEIKLHTINKLLPLIKDDSFKLSALSEFKNQYIIEKSINEKVDPLYVFYELNKSKFSLDFVNMSKRLIKKLGVENE